MASYSGNIRLRLPADLHSRLADIADVVGVSLNTLMVTLLAEGVSRRSNVERAAPANVAEAMAQAVLDSLSGPTRSGELVRHLDDVAPEWRMWIPPYRLIGQAGQVVERGEWAKGGMVAGEAEGAVADKVVADLAGGRFDAVEAAVKAEARSVLNARVVEDVWRRAEESMGGYVGVGEPLVGDASGGRLFDFPLQFERGDAHLQVVVIAGEVVGLLLRPGSPSGQWNA